MHNDVSIVHQDPALLGLTLQAAAYFILITKLTDQVVSQCIQHAVAGTGTDDKIICKVGDFLDIEQKDIFPFFLFQDVDSSSSDF